MPGALCRSMPPGEGVSRMTFGEYLKKERLRQGKTRKEIAEAVGVTERTVQYWENDQRNLTLNNAAKLAVALGMNISIWLGGDTSA